MGLPSSRPWIGEGGFVYQLTQRVLLQWSPADERTRLANLYELLERHGFDDELLARQVPRPEADGSTSLAEAAQIRLGWLTDSGIAAAFAQNPIDPGNVAASLELHGLPMSRPERIGPFVVQRFQRTALQRWVEAVDGGQSVGSVVLVNGGDYFKDFLFADSLVAAPHTPDDARLADVRASPSELVALDLATEGIGTVVWATGYEADHSWLHVPVLDHKGRLRHDGGVVSGSPGLYRIGLNFLRRRKSSFIHGAGDDARDLVGHLAAHIGARAPAEVA